jgi:hypothetical protein
MEWIPRWSGLHGLFYFISHTDYVIFHVPIFLNKLRINSRHLASHVIKKTDQGRPLWIPGLSGIVTQPVLDVFLIQIRSVAANLCVDSKHGATGTELRLDVCVKDGSERTWSHEQVSQKSWEWRLGGGPAGRGAGLRGSWRDRMGRSFWVHLGLG